MDLHDEDSIYHIFLKLLKTHNKALNTFFDGMDFHPGQYHLLAILKDEDGKTQKELSELLHIKPSTTTIMIKRMEKNELVVKKVDEEDRRISRIYITEKGKKMCVEAKMIFENFQTGNFEGFTQEELEVFKLYLLRLKNNIEKNMKS